MLLSYLTKMTAYRSFYLFRADTLQDIINFAAAELIMYIEPDYFILRDPMPEIEGIPAHIPPTFAPHAFAGVNDPRYRDQWGLEFIRAAAAWSTNQAPSTSGVVVAIIDSGIYRDHEDLDHINILPGRNFAIGPGRDRYDTSDDCGHGTQVAGVIAATRNNGVGIASMACGVTILPLRIFYGSPAPPARYSTSASAILYAVNSGAHIINMSFSTENRSITVENAVNYAASRNVWMIAATGNHGNEDGAVIHYPAGFDDVIGVGAVNQNGVRAVFSPYNDSVFIMAPGTAITLLHTGNRYFWSQGTSFSVPKISALAAIARGHDINMTADTFRNLLRNSAIRRGPQGRNYEYGYGIIDVGLFMYNLTNRNFFDFTDVPQNHWARTEIWESARYGLLHGRVQNYVRGAYHGSHRSFFPSASMWRLEFTMALGRLHELNGGNIPWLPSTFTDVNPQSYFPFSYSRYVHWAQQHNIVEGVGNNLFHPGHVVTRQATAVFFYRYTRFLAESCADIRAQMDAVLTPNFNPRAILRSRFPADYHEAPSWAERELAWAVSVGMIEGRGTPQGIRLAPGHEITRAEGAAFIARYRRTYMMDTFIKPRDGGNQNPPTARYTMLSFNLGGTESPSNLPRNR